MLRATPRVELPAADEEPGQQVEARGAAELPDRGRSPVPHLHQARLGHALEGLAYRGAGDPEDLGEPALAGQALPRGQPSVDDLGQDLVEDRVGDEAAGDGSQRERGHG